MTGKTHIAIEDRGVIGTAAMAACDLLCNGYGWLDPEKEPGIVAAFVQAAKSPDGPAAYRFASKALVNGAWLDWDDLDEPGRNWWRLFAALVYTLDQLTDPAAASPAAIMPQARPVAASQQIYERAGRMDEGVMDADDPKSTTRTSAGVPVTRPNAAAPDVNGLSADQQQLIRANGPPSRDEFMAMSAEERRPWASYFGMGSWQSDTAIVTAAPPAGAPQERSIALQVDGEVIAGKALVYTPPELAAIRDLGPANPPLITPIPAPKPLAKKAGKLAPGKSTPKRR